MYKNTFDIFRQKSSILTETEEYFENISKIIDNFLQKCYFTKSADYSVQKNGMVLLYV